MQHKQWRLQDLGTFLKDITPDPVWNYYVDVNNGTGHEFGAFAFCDAMEVIEQPNERSDTCPPEKGGAIITISAFVPWIIGGVSFSMVFCCSDAKETHREIISFGLMRKHRRARGYIA